MSFIRKTRRDISRPITPKSLFKGLGYLILDSLFILVILVIISIIVGCASYTVPQTYEAFTYKCTIYTHCA